MKGRLKLATTFIVLAVILFGIAGPVFASDTLFETWPFANLTGDYIITSGTMRYMEQMPVSTTHKLTSIKMMWCKAAGVNPGPVYVEVYATSGSPALPTGAALDSASLNGNTFAVWNSYTVYEWVFTGGVTLSAGTTYAIVVYCPAATTTVKVYFAADTLAPSVLIIR